MGEQIKAYNLWSALWSISKLLLLFVVFFCYFIFIILLLLFGGIFLCRKTSFFPFDRRANSSTACSTAILLFSFSHLE